MPHVYGPLALAQSDKGKGATRFSATCLAFLKRIRNKLGKLLLLGLAGFYGEEVVNEHLKASAVAVVTGSHPRNSPGTALAKTMSLRPCQE